MENKKYLYSSSFNRVSIIKKGFKENKTIGATSYLAVVRAQKTADELRLIKDWDGKIHGIKKDIVREFIKLNLEEIEHAKAIELDAILSAEIHKNCFLGEDC